MFQPHELKNKNCTGTRGKTPLHQVKLVMVKEYVFKLYPCIRTMEEEQWRGMYGRVFKQEKKKGKLDKIREFNNGSSSQTKLLTEVAVLVISILVICFNSFYIRQTKRTCLFLVLSF